jgi:hypothetical protein
MKNLLIIIGFVGLFSCNNTETPQRTNGYEPVLKDRQDSLEHDVLEGHDQAMARFAKLSKNTGKVQLQIDSLSKIPQAQLNSALLSAFTNAGKELEEAKISMNDWMDGFKLDSLRNDKEARIKYLESELLKVNTMKQKIMNALAKSDSLLNKP